MSADYGFGVHLDVSYADAIPLVKAALKEQGFGVLTEIDVKATLKEKLGEDMDPYVILGACNPKLAHRAIGVEPEIGLLLPCNVVVRADSDGSRVDIADPKAMLGIVGNTSLDEVAAEARAKLLRALDGLRQPA